MKKTIFLVLSFFCCTMVMAQDSFREAFDQMILASGELEDAKSEAIESMAQIAVSKGYSEKEAQELATKFVSESFVPQIREKSCNVYKKYLSVDDMKQAASFFKTEEYKTADKHSKESVKNIANISGLFEKPFKALAEGKTPESIPAPACSEVYKEKFAKLDKLSNMSSIVDGILDQFTQAVGSNPTPETKKMLDSFFSYFKANAGNLMLNMLYPTLTEKDMDVLIKFYDSEVGQRYSKASSEVMPEIMMCAMSSAQSFVSSLEKK